MANEKMVNDTEITVEITTDKFVQFMQGAFYDDRIKTSHTLTVYTTLCLYKYGNTNQAKIAMSTLIKIARTSAKSARADIKLLKELGYIKDIKSGKKAAELNDTNTYIMHDKPVPFTPIENSIVEKNAREFLEVNDTVLKEAVEEEKDIRIHIPKRGDMKVEFSPARKSSKTEDIPAEVIEDKPVENAPVVEDKPARKKIKLLAVKKTSNVENAPVKSARKSKFKVVKPSVKTSNEVAQNEYRKVEIGSIKRKD